MSPEYAYLGHVSTKSDMFSFGVIILEMVTGRRSNSMSECPDSTPLLSYVWGKWRVGSATDVVDMSLGARGYPESEVLNCLEVGLLCVQENPDDRPDASTAVLMLSSPTSTPDEGRRAPSRPAFFFGSDNTTTGGRAPLGSNASLIGGEQTSTASVSKNEVTISEFEPR
ncbi:G-type lectin S-receptor-like serine/threonine-protein kinase [Dichanthelium oligosanthes]|uniref:G-type lectin S-receptor-like serine/threonine-protein kinase n=1 Tax=Dichanthelium oligosanthes TaxID=888268 RepID=A0A1E5WI48_9POAL|nr:G-type lectin S-receptor-like serine/threonine-protein kinase [Dichanthelium oligosanthes]